MARTIVVGDVHGCADELDALLAEVGFGAGDCLVLTGDLVGRGPEPRRVVRRARELGARAVRGNHEDRLLRWRSGRTPAPPPRSLRPLLDDPRQQLDDGDWAWLQAMPLWIGLPEHEALVVHAGLAPGVPLADQQPHVMLNIRCLREGNVPDARRGEALWATSYRGPPHVLFGHNALEQAQLHPWATGLDTGCVYGGRLTALVLAAGARLPGPAERARWLTSVPARQLYVPIEGRMP